MCCVFPMAPVPALDSEVCLVCGQPFTEWSCKSSRKSLEMQPSPNQEKKLVTLAGCIDWLMQWNYISLHAITITTHHMSYTILTRFRRVISHHVLQQDHLISNRTDRASSILLLP